MSITLGSSNFARISSISALFLSWASLCSQTYKFPKAESGIFIMELDSKELNGDAWALNPKLHIAAPAKFTLQNKSVSKRDLSARLLEYALLCPPERRFVLLRVDKDVPASTLIFLMQAIQSANRILSQTKIQISGILITAVIPIDSSSHNPIFPIQAPAKLVKELPPPPSAP